MTKTALSRAFLSTLNRVPAGDRLKLAGGFSAERTEDIQSNCISMKVAKWGNSLAIRLPAAVVESLDLKEGDQIEISASKKHGLKVSRDRRLEEAVERLRLLARPLPPGYRFDREEANER